MQLRQRLGGPRMRTEVLSEHPDVMLADAGRERRRGVTEQFARVESLRGKRGRARSERRWLAWLRLALAESGANREAKRLHLLSALRTAREQQMLAGQNAERRVAGQFGAALNDEWALLRGYCNARGEIDALLLGQAGCSQSRRSTAVYGVFIRGDEWIAQQIDKYRRPHGARFPIQDKKAAPRASKSRSQWHLLTRWLSTNKRGTPITPVVLLSHPAPASGRWSPQRCGSKDQSATFWPSSNAPSTPWTPGGARASSASSAATTNSTGPGVLRREHKRPT
jgi:hypothetical protein